MKRLRHKGQEISRGRYPIGKSTDWDAVALNLLPVADIADPPAALELLEEYLRKEV